MKIITVLCCVLSLVMCDVYMQNPRGSNNRLNENTANRQNANRLFDSQNNNKGGYNTGDRLAGKARNDVRRAYSMQYYASGPGRNEASKLLVEWTNQHGCGSNGKVDCNIVIQYMCQTNGTHDDYPSNSRARGTDEEVARKNEQKVLYLRDGVTTSDLRYDAPSTREQSSDRHWYTRMKKNVDRSDSNKGRHESIWWYDACKFREANGGLFTADQDLQRDKNVGYVSATRTRQNNDGDRSGLECPEERDYFPYWVPTVQQEQLSAMQNTPWIDLAWLGDTDRCTYIKQNSFNRNSKWRCVLSTDDEERPYGKSITEDDCDDEGGEWVEFVSFLEVLTDVTSSSQCRSKQNGDTRNRIFWGKLRSDDRQERCIVQAPEIVCDEAPTARVNHLGNADGGENPSRFEMHMPYFPSGEAKRCVLRLRYNITTGDYDGWNTFSEANDNDDVIENNPEVDVLGNGDELQLALNTAQTARTFQDRSHAFVVLPRIDGMEGKTLHNLNVKGKRGNIVQTFPATEYDFMPSKLEISRNDLVHVQWTGSNTHDNNNDGDAGQGTDGTDRHNLLQMESLDKNYPLTLSQANFWNSVSSLTDPEATGEDIAVGLASSGFYCGKRETNVCPSKYSLERNRNLDDELNNAPASYFGHVLKFSRTGTLLYMCSRNNNFSNRSQKGILVVKN